MNKKNFVYLDPRRAKRHERKFYTEIDNARYAGENAAEYRDISGAKKKPTNPYPPGKRHDAWNAGYALVIEEHFKGDAP